MTAAMHIQIENLSKVFETRGRSHLALDSVSLKIPRGASLGIVGESGSGKSTLARLIVGLDTPSEGTISVHSQEGRCRPQMVFQNPFEALNPRMTIRQSLSEPLENTDIAKSDHSDLLLDAMRSVNLPNPDIYMDRLPSQLSGGQLQRIVMARALILKPDLLVGDEPVSMLDVSARAHILNLFRALKGQLTSLFISHDLTLIGYVCETVIVLYQGRVVEAGPTSSVLRHPQHPYTQALIAATPRPDTDQSRNPLPLVTPAETVDPSNGCGFYPRCQQVQPICIQSRPELSQSLHGAACHFSNGTEA